MSEDSDYTSEVSYPLNHQANGSASQYLSVAHQYPSPQRSSEISRENSYETNESYQRWAYDSANQYGEYGEYQVSFSSNWTLLIYSDIFRLCTGSYSFVTAKSLKVSKKWSDDDSQWFSYSAEEFLQYLIIRIVDISLCFVLQYFITLSTFYKIRLVVLYYYCIIFLDGTCVNSPFIMVVLLYWWNRYPRVSLIWTRHWQSSIWH